MDIKDLPNNQLVKQLVTYAQRVAIANAGHAVFAASRNEVLRRLKATGEVKVAASIIATHEDDLDLELRLKSDGEPSQIGKTLNENIAASIAKSDDADPVSFVDPGYSSEIIHSEDVDLCTDGDPPLSRFRLPTTFKDDE